MNRRNLFQALIGSAAASTAGASPLSEPEDGLVYGPEPAESDEFLPVFDGWHVQETAPQSRFRSYRILAPKCKYYHRSEIDADPWLMERYRKWPEIAKGWIY